MVQGVALPPDPCHTTFVERETPPPLLMFNQTVLKPVMIKVNGNWQKVYKDKEVAARYSSWKSINLLIDFIMDQSVENHTILHKPFAPVFL